MVQTKEKEELLKCEVKIRRRIFHPDVFGVYEIELKNAHEIYGGLKSNGEFITTIVGEFEKKFHENEEYIMYGTKTRHPRYGEQIKVQFVKTKFDSLDQIGTFMRHFCQQKIVDQILQKYGADVIGKIVNDEFDYSDIKGMGKTRYESLRTKVMENEYMATLIGALGEYGITPNQMKKVIKQFGDSAMKKITENPYNLCLIHGVGFMKADEVAKRMGYDLESPFRIHEAIKYVLSENQKSGHTWIHESKLLNNCVEILALTMDKVEDQLSKVQKVHITDDKRVSLSKTYGMEKYVAKRLSEINRQSTELDVDVEKFLSRQKDEKGIELTNEQRSLFYNFKANNLNFLIGYAGTGKSFMQNLILELADELKLHVLLLASTGKAAKVLEGYTGRPASTIHRAVGFSEGAEQNVELSADVVIVDEVSMMDIPIAAKLLKGINNRTRVLFCGDDYQIPSVGVGKILYDCINSGIFNVTKLTKVFRQQDGGILDIATKIRTKEYFVSNDFIGRKEFGSDTVLYSVPQVDIQSIYLTCLNEALKKYNADDIQVLSPTKKGILGTFSINNEIQGIVNPADDHKNEIKVGALVYREGDRVINIANNYGAMNTGSKSVVIYNGDMGSIDDVNNADKQIIVDYGFDQVVTMYENIDSMMHSYALTIHKSQGSAFPVVILIMDKAHKWQMNANLLYTGITRTQKKLYIVCQADVINAAMRKNESMARNTFLYEMLLEENEIANR